MKFNRLLAGVSTFVMITAVSAISAVNVFAQTSDDDIVASLSKKLSLEITSIADSPVPGLKQVFTNRGLFYVSDNGEFFLQARVYNIKEGVEDETETR